MRNLFILLFLVSFIFLGCAHSLKSAEKIDYSKLAKELLDNLFNSYKTYNRMDFLKLIADDFSPDRQEFLNKLEEDFYGKNILEINYFIDNVLKTQDKLVVVFKWEKKISPFESKEPILLKGKSEFVFKNVNNRWLLYQIKGDSPFR